MLTTMLRLALRLTVIATLILALGGWKILTIEEARRDKERSGGNFNAQTYVESIWAEDVLAYAQQTAQELADLLGAVQQDFTKAGETLGQLSDDGSRGSFFTTATAQVVSTDTDSRAGSITLALQPPLTGWEIKLLTGPVILGTTLRDATPTIHFNHFANQIDYAEVGNQLTIRAMSSVRPALEQLEPGDSIIFVGSFSLSPREKTVHITPLSIQLSSVASNDQSAAQGTSP